MAEDLLLEIGTEELPASFVRQALAAMPGLLGDLLKAERLDHGPLETFGTPRRLAVRARQVADAQEDLSEVVHGPPRSVATDAEGAWTRAALGFARKQGVDPAALRIVETDKGEYVAAHREERGRSAAEVLPGVLESLCARIPFPKSMRWADLDVLFGRPVHWLLALHGTRLIPFGFAGARSGRTTRGHRFLAPEPRELSAAADYVDPLRQAHVIVDLEERRTRMREALEAAAVELGGSLVVDEFLMEECVSLVEEPHVVAGRFDEDFLTLPDAVVVSVMRDHQRYFAVRDQRGERLLPRYLNVVNTAEDPTTIARGNDRVLRARLADARFFVQEDLKRPLAERTEELSRVVFQSKLGTLGEKVDRLVRIGTELAPEDLDAGQVEQAARLCKADLVTHIVGEFPELQGEMGRHYALEEEAPQDVADALRDHYRPRGAGDAVPSKPLGALLAVADRMDTLAGCFGIGLKPSGSADPYALRRAALGVIRVALEGPLDVDLGRWLGACRAAYAAQGRELGPAMPPELDGFFRARLRAFYGEAFPGDLVEACLAAWGGAPNGVAGRASIRDLDARVRALGAFRRRPEYDSLAVAFKRTFNIAGDAPEGMWNDAALEEEAERALARRFSEVRERIGGAVADGAYEKALSTVADELRQPIDRFFDEVFVMVDDAQVRDNRLRLLGRIADTLKGIAHFQLLST